MNLRIAQLRIAYKGAILRWAILRWAILNEYTDRASLDDTHEFISLGQIQHFPPMKRMMIMLVMMMTMMSIVRCMKHRRPRGTGGILAGAA